MMDRALERHRVHAKLRAVLGTSDVYYQPPSSVKIKYPCIVYTLSDIDIDHANGSAYKHKYKYTVTIIDHNPDSSLPDAILELPFCSWDRSYTADNLNHFVFTLYR